IAGDGACSYSGDTGPAKTARLNDPVGVALDLSGNLYIADLGNYRIRRVSSDGIITTIAGTGTPGYSGDGGPATNAQLNSPIGLAVDSVGNIYIGDLGCRCVRRVATNGVITTIAGTGVYGYSGDGGPATSAQLGGPY